MYEMYPTDWPATVDPSPRTGTSIPRRRARREHSVVPSVLTITEGGARTDQPAR